MDGKQFDRIAKAHFLSISRRGTLGALAVGAVTAGKAALGWRGVAAQVETEENDPTCDGKPAINNRNCVNDAGRCTRDSRCRCAKTVNAEKRCVIASNFTCPRRDQCDRNKDCGRDEVCVRVAGCGCAGRQKCMKLCG